MARCSWPLIAGAACTRLQLWDNVLTCAEGMCVACDSSYHVPCQHLNANDTPSLLHVISIFHAADIWQLCIVFVMNKYVMCYVLKCRHGFNIHMRSIACTVCAIYSWLIDSGNYTYAVMFVDMLNCVYNNTPIYALAMPRKYEHTFEILL